MSAQSYYHPSSRYGRRSDQDDLAYGSAPYNRQVAGPPSYHSNENGYYHYPPSAYPPSYSSYTNYPASYSAAPSKYDDDDYYSDFYPSSSRERRHHRSRRRSSSASRSPSPLRHRKSFGEQALSILGLGPLGDRGRPGKESRVSTYRSHSSPSPPGHRTHSSSQRHRPRSPSPATRDRLASTVKAGLVAAAAEALRLRHEPGSWEGEKGKRVLTAAIGASGASRLLDDGKRQGHHSTSEIISSTLAGLATNHLINGRRSDGPRSSRSGPNEALKNLATAGVLALTGKKAIDSHRSRSKARSRHRSDSHGRSASRHSYDSGRHHHGRRHHRRSSVSGLSRNLSSLDLDDKHRRSRNRHHRRDDCSDSESDDPDYYNYQHRHGRGRGYSPSSTYSNRYSSSGYGYHGRNHY